MKVDIHCLKCKGVMFKAVPIGAAGHLGVNSDTKLQLQSDGIDRFYVCPHCSAKNVVVSVTQEGGLPGSKISYIKE